MQNNRKNRFFSILISKAPRALIMQCTVCLLIRQFSDNCAERPPENIRCLKSVKTQLPSDTLRNMSRAEKYSKSDGNVSEKKTRCVFPLTCDMLHELSTWKKFHYSACIFQALRQ